MNSYQQQRSPLRAQSGVSEWSGISKYSNGPAGESLQHRFAEEIADGGSPRSLGSGDGDEELLAQQWRAFDRFLQPHYRDASDTRASRAKDKLVQLSRQQFQELSTDVFDEMLRRQNDREPFLHEQRDFHPKRNQARQKLSSVPDSRFRDLTADVFHEIDRRRLLRLQTTQPPPSQHALERELASAGNSNEIFGKPLQRNLQQETIVPQKSTMVEDEDDDRRNSGSLSPSSRRKPSIDARSLKGGERSSVREAKLEGEVLSLREELEQKELELVTLRNIKTERDSQNAKIRSLYKEMDELRLDHQKQLRSLQSELALAQQESKDTRYDSLVQEHQTLQQQLREQHEITEEVRSEAKQFLDEMRRLGARHEAPFRDVERLSSQVREVQEELKLWKQRYAQARTQARSLKAGSMGAGQISQPTAVASGALLSDAGAIRDSNVTAFQIAIDEFIVAARSDNVDPVMEYMRDLVKQVRAVTQDVEEWELHHVKSDAALQKSKDRVAESITNLISATKGHVHGLGLSPISLLDAAISHVSTSVIDLIRLAKVRPSAKAAAGKPVLPTSPTRSAYAGDKKSPSSSLNNSPNSKQVSPRYDRSSWRRETLRNSGNPPDAPPVDTEIANLRSFLESTTETVIDTIQNLLSAIRQDQQKPALQRHVTEITNVLDRIVTRGLATTRTTSSTRLKNRCERVIRSLEECNSRLVNMAENLVGQTGLAEKSFKQTLASVAFDTAKTTKALVRAVEEAETDGGDDLL